MPGKVTKPRVSHPRGEGEREPRRGGGAGGGSARVFPYTRISSFFGRYCDPNIGACISLFLKTNFKNNAGTQKSPSALNVRVIPYIAWAAAGSRAVAAHYYTNRYPASGRGPLHALTPPPGGQVSPLSPQELSRQ